MPSPFPGMNPYLEQPGAWEDFHTRFIVGLAEALKPKIGPSLLISVETRVYLHELSAEERGRFGGQADLGVVAKDSSRLTSPASSPSAIAAPLQLSLPSVMEERYRWLEVRDANHDRLVTAIEVLSPTNKKPGPDRDDYLSKPGWLLMGPANFVAIDLRRGGHRPAAPQLPECAYYILVSRIPDRPKIGVWPLGLRDPLPLIPIPLRPADAEVVLDLQTVFHTVFDRATFADSIYRRMPTPPLSPDDLAWAKSLVPSIP